MKQTVRIFMQAYWISDLPITSLWLSGFVAPAKYQDISYLVAKFNTFLSIVIYF